MTRLLLTASLLFLSGQTATAEPAWTPVPAGRGNIVPVRTFDTEHLLLELDLDIAGGRVSGTATHRLKPLTPDLKDVVFDQRGLTIHAVTVNGKDASYDVEYDSLHITLPAYVRRHPVDQRPLCGDPSNRTPLPAESGGIARPIQRGLVSGRRARPPPLVPAPRQP